MQENNQILVCEKPDWISYEDIRDLLWRANEENRSKGVVLGTSELDGEGLEKKLGPTGKCFVALEGDILVGTLSVRFIEKNKWYAKGLIGKFNLIAIDPEYQGKHILTKLIERGYQAVKEAGCNIIEVMTAENNEHAIKVYKHYGFRLVDYVLYKGLDHYTVAFAKWLDKKGPSKLKCNIKYMTRKMKIRHRKKLV